MFYIKIFLILKYSEELNFSKTKTQICKHLRNRLIFIRVLRQIEIKSQKKKQQNSIVSLFKIT
jgi:hypothetical protein